jgi:uncharacterized membrane protein
MKKLIWGGMFVGSTAGGFLPMLWNSSAFSMSSVLLSAVGGVLGIYAGLKLAQMLGIE